MPYKCYLCNELIQGGTRGLFAHLRSAHFICETRNVSLKCGQGDCVRCYASFNSLAHHLRSQHPDGVEVDFSEADCDESYIPEVNDSAEVPVPASANLNPVLFTQRDKNCAAASFVASLLTSTSVTQKNIQSVVDHTGALVNDIVADITGVVMSSLKAANINLSESITVNLQERLQNYSNPFDQLDSKHKRDTYFQKNYGMVKPKSVFLGNRYDQSFSAVRGKARQVIKRDTFQYVPLLDLLALLLSDTGIYKETSMPNKPSDGHMYDFRDGLLFKTIPLFKDDENALQLCLYFDECEVVNPLGSRRGIHKIGFIYMSLLNMRPMFRSRLNNIHILAAFNSLDRVKYGFAKILAPIVRDIKQLEKGVDLRLRNGVVLHRRGTLVQLVGDNLGVNQICGFVESFSATHFCRMCMINRADCDSACTEDSVEMRNKHQYSEQLQKLLKGKIMTKDCGIKTSCLLNTLQYFHVAENVTVDIMHDVLEGCAAHEVKLLLFSFIYEKKYFSLELLNARIASFDYGISDRSNKPTELSEGELKDQQKNGLNQKASQMYCLLVILPFLVGGEVPANDQMWRLYLILRDIVDIVFSDSCTVGDSVFLKYKIEEHHSLFKEVFPHKHLLPKHHIMTHYPSVMRKVGPLSRCSSMRFEGKHYESKRLSGVVSCFKDICKTVVLRHQLNQCVQIAAGNCATYRVDVRRVEMSTIRELPEANLILSAITGAQMYDDISHTSVVNICGTEYRKHMVIVIDVDDEPKFCTIKQCLICVDDNVYFVCQNLTVAEYTDHLHAYAVCPAIGMRVINHRSLKYYKPLSIRYLFETQQEYVVFP